VECEGSSWLSDVGFGNGFLEPLPLEEGPHAQSNLVYRLDRLDARWWRFRNSIAGGPSFDFTLEPRVVEEFAAKCHQQQTAPESPFVRSTVCHRHAPEGILTLRGAVLRQIGGDAIRESVVGSAAELGTVLRDRFGLAVPDLDTLWKGIERRHHEWVAQSSPPLHPPTTGA
jgi:N-hydroxyarylamine O-acetyltransferase